MHLHQAKTLEKIEQAGDEGSSEVLTQPATLDPWDFSIPNRDEVLGLLKPDGDRKRTIWLVAGALAAGFGLGWAGGFSPTCAESTPHNNRINGLAKKLALHFWSGGR
jgi:hypothetical protein